MSESKPKQAGAKQAAPKKLANGLDPSIGKATQFKPGQSGNPNGVPKGTKHISTWIRELLEDEEFTGMVPSASSGWREFKGAPMKAIIQAQIIRALAGDAKAFDALAKYGYGSKLEITGADGTPLMPIGLDAAILARRTDGKASSSPTADRGE